MQIKYLSLLLVAATMAFVSCNDDDDNDDQRPVGNINQPSSVIGIKDAMPYAGRKEIPAIKDPTMFIVHYVPNGNSIQVNYCIEWDKAQKTQRWSAYYLNSNTITSKWKRSNWNGAIWKGRYWTGDPFQEDSIIPKPYRTTLRDYSGQLGRGDKFYDRGHIVNSQDRLSSKDMNGQTYYLSNIQPQVNGFNAGVWLNMENKVNALGRSLRGDEYLYIVKGGTTQPTAKVPQPFIDDPNINIKVPRYFFMAILKFKSDKTYQAIGFWAEHKINSDQNLKKYCKSIDELEELTGINFFHNLDNATENAVESQCNPSNWGIYQ